jgi:hypothetical protein
MEKKELFLVFAIAGSIGIIEYWLHRKAGLIK